MAVDDSHVSNPSERALIYEGYELSGLLSKFDIICEFMGCHSDDNSRRAIKIPVWNSDEFQLDGHDRRDPKSSDNLQIVSLVSGAGSTRETFGSKRRSRV